MLVGTLLFPEQFAEQSEALILTPVMLLWINLVTDGLPALALGASVYRDALQSSSGVVVRSSNSGSSSIT